MRLDIKGTIVSDDEAWIYDWFGIPYCSPKAINEGIEKANGELLDIYINSGGGDIFAGSEIYSAVRGYSGQVNLHIVGLAASAASVIACAGHCDISPTAMIMVHNVSCRASGDYHDMDKQSEILQKANETIANAYVAKTGMSMEDALAMMDKETWLSANDAVAKGLVDEIAKNKNLQLVAGFNDGVIPREIIDKMQKQRLEDKANADFLCRKSKTQAQLNLLKLGGIK